MTVDPTGGHHFAEIECNEAAAPGVFAMMAVVLPLLGFLAIWIARVPLRFNVPAREFNPLVMLPLVATLAGLFFAVWAIGIALRLRRFGASRLTLARRPRIGGRVLGRITSTVEVVPRDDWRLVLQCIETIKDVGSKRVSRTDLTRWEYRTTMPAGSASLRAGIPVDIAIPDDCLELTDPIERARTNRGTLKWVLYLKAPVAGLDYLASFLVPIRSERGER
jgi:hypothetical protein